MLEARTGHPLSSQSEQATTLYQQAIDLILGSESGAAELLDKALELDNDFAMAAAARYYLAQDVGEAGAQKYKAQTDLALANTTEWERAHIEVLIGLIDEFSATRDKAIAYVEQNPADLLVISKLTGNMFFFDGPQKLDSVLNVYESVEHALADDWAFLARIGFALSEAGQHQKARQYLDRALAIRPQSLYTIHGLAHLLHDEGAAEESAELLHKWLDEFGSGAREGQMYGHVQWHLALSEWQTGVHDAAMTRYLEYCAPETTTCGPVLTLADCGGFLLREFLQSGQTKPLDKDVRDHIERVWGMLGHPFIALHVAGLYATAGDIAGLKHCEETISAKPDSTYRDVSLTLISSLIALVQKNYAAAVTTLASLSPAARVGIGGSNVERILVDLIEAHCTARL